MRTLVTAFVAKTGICGPSRVSFSLWYKGWSWRHYRRFDCLTLSLETFWCNQHFIVGGLRPCVHSLYMVTLSQWWTWAELNIASLILRCRRMWSIFWKFLLKLVILFWDHEQNPWRWPRFVHLFFLKFICSKLQTDRQTAMRFVYMCLVLYTCTSMVVHNTCLSMLTYIDSVYACLSQWLCFSPSPSTFELRVSAPAVTLSVNDIKGKTKNPDFLFTYKTQAVGIFRPTQFHFRNVKDKTKRKVTLGNRSTGRVWWSPVKASNYSYKPLRMVI